MDHALEKLEVLGATLPFPHQSSVRGATALRELRPRAGRSSLRAFYRQIGAAMVVGAIGPEAKVNRRGFERAVKAAQQRLDALEKPGEDEKPRRRS